MKRKIYVASSWRNEYYPEVVEKLREAGHDVYDFRNPPSSDPGFKWNCVSEDYMEWTPQQYRDMLHHPKAERQFHNDIEAMEACDTCVLVLPCGRSAHTEAGWFAGKGKDLNIAQEHVKKVQFKESADKIRRMYESATANGFTSFAEA